MDMDTLHKLGEIYCLLAGTTFFTYGLTYDGPFNRVLIIAFTLCGILIGLLSLLSYLALPGLVALAIACSNTYLLGIGLRGAIVYANNRLTSRNKLQTPHVG